MISRDFHQDFFGDDAAACAGGVAYPAAESTLPGLAEAPTEPSSEGAFEKHWLHTLAHVLTEEIQELISAEKQVAAMLPRLAQAAADPILWAICQAEALQSVRQGQRLERMQALLGQQSDGRVCQQIENLVLGLEEIISENQPGRPRDLALVAAARKIKQFEIAGYCSARDFAQLLGLGAVVELLQQTIDDQTAMDARLGIYGEILATQSGQSEFR